MSQPPLPPGEPPYGNYPPQYGQVRYGPPDHPQATLVLVLGIVGITVCSVVAPVAWVMGGRVVAEIDASNGQIGGRANANAGRILGIVGTALIGLAVVVAVVSVFIFLAAAAEA